MISFPFFPAKRTRPQTAILSAVALLAEVEVLLTTAGRVQFDAPSHRTLRDELIPARNSWNESIDRKDVALGCEDFWTLGEASAKTQV